MKQYGSLLIKLANSDHHFKRPHDYLFIVCGVVSLEHFDLDLEGRKSDVCHCETK